MGESEVGSEKNRWTCLYKWYCYSYSVDRMSFLRCIHFILTIWCRGKQLGIVLPSKAVRIQLSYAERWPQLEVWPRWRDYQSGGLVNSVKPAVTKECPHHGWTIELQVNPINALIDKSKSEGEMSWGASVWDLSCNSLTVLRYQSFAQSLTFTANPQMMDQEVWPVVWPVRLADPLGAGMARRSWLLGGILNGPMAIRWLLHEDCTNCWLNRLSAHMDGITRVFIGVFKVWCVFLSETLDFVRSSSNM